MLGREESRLAVSALASALIVLFSVSVAGAENAEDEGTSASGPLEVVIVTARKREESLLEIPESVAAISGADIDRQNLKGLEQIGFQVPNLNLSHAPRRIPERLHPGTWILRQYTGRRVLPRRHAAFFGCVVALR